MVDTKLISPYNHQYNNLCYNVFERQWALPQSWPHTLYFSPPCITVDVKDFILLSSIFHREFTVFLLLAVDNYLIKHPFLRKKQLYSSQSEARQIQTCYGTAQLWCLWLIINNSKIIMQNRRGSSTGPHKLFILLACGTQVFFNFSDINTEGQPNFLTNNNCAQFEGECTYADS